MKYTEFNLNELKSSLEWTGKWPIFNIKISISISHFVQALTSILFWIQGPMTLAWLAYCRRRRSLFCCRACSSIREWSRWGTSCFTYSEHESHRKPKGNGTMNVMLRKMRVKLSIFQKFWYWNIFWSDHLWVNQRQISSHSWTLFYTECANYYWSHILTQSCVINFSETEREMYL